MRTAKFCENPIEYRVYSGFSNANGPTVPLVGNICTIGTEFITNGTIGKEISKNGNAIGTNGTNVTNQWYHCENPTDRDFFLQFWEGTIARPDWEY